MTYQRHLSFHLRGRGYREDEIVGIMSDVALAELAGPVVLWPPLGLLVAGVLAGFLTDYLRPAPSRT